MILQVCRRSFGGFCSRRTEITSRRTEITDPKTLAFAGFGIFNKNLIEGKNLLDDKAAVATPHLVTFTVR
jgi:hypothetical protein